MYHSNLEYLSLSESTGVSIASPIRLLCRSRNISDRQLFKFLICLMPTLKALACLKYFDLPRCHVGVSETPFLQARPSASRELPPPVRPWASPRQSESRAMEGVAARGPRPAGQVHRRSRPEGPVWISRHMLHSDFLRLSAHTHMSHV